MVLQFCIIAGNNQKKVLLLNNVIFIPEDKTGGKKNLVDFAPIFLSDKNTADKTICWIHSVK